MSWFQLSKKQTRTVYCVVGGIAVAMIGASRAEADSAQTFQINTAPATPPLTTCQSAVQQAKSAVLAFHDACGTDTNCLQTVGACAAASNAAANATLSGANDGTSCDNLVSLCPSDNAGGSEIAKQDLSTAQSTRQSAMADKNTATQQLQQQQQQSGQQQNQAMTQIVALNKAHRDAVQAAQNTLLQQENAAQQAKTQAIATAQAAMNAINDKLIKLRDDERKAADAAQQAQFDWQTACRASAQQKSIAKQAAIDALLKQNQAAVLAGTRNQSSDGIFGLQYRRVAKRNKQIADAYNQELVQCLNGTTPDGLAAKQKADKAADDYKEIQANALDQEAQFKTEQAQAQATMNAAIASADTQTAQLVAQSQQTINNADQDYQTGLMLAQQQMAQTQQNVQVAQQTNLQNLQQSDTALQQATRDQIVASNKVACEAANGGDKTQAQADAAPNSAVNIQKAKKALNDAWSFCQAVDASCSDGAAADTASRSSVHTACDQAKTALDGGSNAQPVDDGTTRTLLKSVTPAGGSGGGGGGAAGATQQ